MTGRCGSRIRVALAGFAASVVWLLPGWGAAESLYQEGSFRPLTADNKAFRVGDSLTIQVFENSSATNKLLATLTVTVTEVLPNRELRVAGEQLLTVNEELQKVNLEGRVRPQDISDGNVVLSTRLADARITYVGEGDVSERARRSAWRRIFDWLGL